MANFGLSILDGDLKYTAPDGTVIDVAEAGSGGAFCVTFTASGGGASSDKTFAEISAAILAGQFVYGRASGTSVNLFVNLVVCSDETGATFISITEDEGAISIMKILIGTDDTIIVSEKLYDLSSLIVEN